MLDSTASEHFSSLGTAVSTENYFTLQKGDLCWGGNFNGKNPKTVESVAERIFLVANCWGEAMELAQGCRVATGRSLDFFFFFVGHVNHEKRMTVSVVTIKRGYNWLGLFPIITMWLVRHLSGLAMKCGAMNETVSLHLTLPIPYNVHSGADFYPAQHG